MKAARYLERVIQVLIMVFSGAILGQNKDTIQFYEAIPNTSITAKASSEFSNFGVEETINGDGLVHHEHISQNLGKTMWISQISKKKVQANIKTKKGPVWLLYTFDMPRKVDLIEIWNHNQNNHLNRGLQKVYIEYSEDGKKWKLLRNGNKEYFIIPKSRGQHFAPPSLKISLDGTRIKYFCITADGQKGNYYHDGSKKTIAWAQEQNQNINYYGLSEIQFFQKKEKYVNNLPKINDAKISVSPGYLKTNTGPRREFNVTFNDPLYTGGTIEVEVNGSKTIDSISSSTEGKFRVESSFPPGLSEESTTVNFRFKSRQGSFLKTEKVEGARKWKVYFLPHSHLDIGYTHIHEKVMNRQIRNIDSALHLISATKEYPEASRFKWNVETMWPVMEYLKRYKNTPEIKRFEDAVKNGDIELNASLGNILTGLSKQEELTHLFDDGSMVAKRIGVHLNSVMMSDVPGASWGIVTAMAENGIKYFSMAPNYVPYLKTGGSRVGLAHIEWGNRPFYWKSQSGKEKILCWSAGTGYSFFHDWLTGRLSSSGLQPIWENLKNLENDEFPYNITYFRYTVNGDNGPPDAEMSDVIKAWNEKYEYPKFIIGTTTQLFSEFETKYQKNIPTYKGDFTPYWEEGAASTAAELKINRNNSERLNQLEILWSLVAPDKYPYHTFYSAWRNIVLFSEHTWGASASGPSPEAELTKELWREKRAFAISADSLTNAIEKQLSFQINSDKASFIQVFNTNLWSRTDVVKLKSRINLEKAVLRDEKNDLIPIQKSEDGEYIFIAEKVPALSSKAYKIDFSSDSTSSGSDLQVKDNVLSNSLLRIEINKKTGAIEKLINLKTGKNFAAEGGLNQYIYTGRNGESLKRVDTVRITSISSGPVAASLQISSMPEGTNGLKVSITLYRDIGRVDIQNVVNKTKSYQFENVRFKFPFAISNSETDLGLAFSSIRPEREQLSGANKNFFSVNNGVSISGLHNSVLLTTIDTPIIELGTMTGEQWRKDTEEFLAWKRSTTSSSTIYSWVMNNSWGTNYKASQEGLASFNYSIVPLAPDSNDAKKRSLEIAQPLKAYLSNTDKTYTSLFKLKGKNKIAVSTIRPTQKGNGFIIRLTNLSKRSVHSSFIWEKLNPTAVFECTNQEENLNKMDPTSLWMKPYGTLTLKLKTNQNLNTNGLQ